MDLYSQTPKDTDRSRTDAENTIIRNSKIELEAIFDSMFEPMFLIDENYIILRANKALIKLLKTTYTKILGRKCYEILHKTKHPPKDCLFKNGRINDEVISETKNYIFGGDYATIIRKLSDPSQKNKYLHIIQDISLTKNLTKQVIYAVDTERKALSSEIHDDLLQSGFSAMTYCNSVYQKVRSKEDKKRLELAIKSLDKLLSTGRKIIKELRPPVLESVGLIAAIKEHAKNIFEDYPIVFTISDSKVKKLPSELENTILRIAQECLMNILKHSKASKSHVSISLKSNKSIEVTIEDNGIGLPENFDSKKSSSHIGMKLMKERAEMLNGCFCISSKHGKGTKISVVFPLLFTEKITQEYCSGKQLK